MSLKDDFDNVDFTQFHKMDEKLRVQLEEIISKRSKEHDDALDQWMMDCFRWNNVDPRDYSVCIRTFQSNGKESKGILIFKSKELGSYSYDYMKNEFIGRVGDSGSSAYLTPPNRYPKKEYNQDR